MCVDKKESIVRRFLKNGDGRKEVSWMMLFLTSASCAVLFGYDGSVCEDRVINAMQLLGAVAALLSGLTYNLRKNNIAFYVDSLRKLCPSHDVIKAGRILTNLALISFITAMFLLTTAFFANINYIVRVMLVISSGLTAYCATQYVYVLFAQEKLEEEYVKIMEQSMIKDIKDNEADK